MKYQPSLSVRELEFMANSMDVHQFRAAIRAGAFRMIRVVADGWWIQIEAQPLSRKDEDNPVTLITARDRVRRRFRSVEAAMLVLKNMGAKTVVIDMSNWQSKPLKRSFGGRPDMAERLRAAHAVARQQEQLKSGETLLLGAGEVGRHGGIQREGDAERSGKSKRVEVVGTSEFSSGRDAAGGNGGWNFASEAYRKGGLRDRMEAMERMPAEFQIRDSRKLDPMELTGPSTPLEAKEPKRRKKLTEEEALHAEKVSLCRKACRQNSPEVAAAIRSMLGLDDDPDC